MDPTKPILNLYGDSQPRRDFREYQEEQSNHYRSSNVTPYGNNNQASRYGRNNNPTPVGSGYQRKVANMQPSYSELEDKYQELYQAYRQKSSKIEQLEQENNQVKSQNVRLRNQTDKFKAKVEEYNSTIVSKNLQLEDVYRKLQEETRSGNRLGKQSSDAAISKLEQGLRQAINSNYQILRESALTELKHYMIQ